MNASQRLRCWIRDFGHEKQPEFIRDLTEVLDLLDQQQKFLEEFGDLAICKVEGVAHELRKIVGYVDGPYPELKRE